MYTEYFGLRDRPFSIAPDPEYLYMSALHREALAHLIYGIRTDGGFVLLTGEVGTGKTTICRCLLEQVPADAEIAFVLNPKVSAVELLETICDELQIEYPPQTNSIKVLVDAINNFLLETHAKGRKTVLIIDEAQNLRTDVLEQIRLLTNLETNKQKLLQVIMIGQPELREMLMRRDLRQLNQRVTARYHLQPLNHAETTAYIEHRLMVAGVERPLFSRRALRRVFILSHGVPRLINLLCDRALLGAYATGQNSVSPGIVCTTAREILGTPTRHYALGGITWSPRLRHAFLLAGIISAAAVAVFLALPPESGTRETQTHPAATQATNTLTRETPTTAQTSKQSKHYSPNSDNWFSRLALHSTRTAAEKQLFARWNKTYTETQADIDAAAGAAGLSVLSRRASLDELRALNRPAILTLEDEQGEKHHVILTGMDAANVILTCADQVARVPAPELAKYWRGEFTLLWQPPETYATPVYPGHDGAVVAWLDQQLAQLNHRAPALKSRLSLADDLLDELRMFQSAHGLTPDGILGPVTLIHLNNKLARTQPHLQLDPEVQR